MYVRLSFNTFLVVCSLTFVAVVQADTRSGKTVTISADQEINDDLYIFAQTIVVEGNVAGDLVAFGQNVTVNGKIEGDLTVAAQQIVIGGEIADDARVSGQVITLKTAADIGDDLVAGGISIECAEGSRIGGEVNCGGYQADFAGIVGENLSAAMANCTLTGSIGGNVDVIVDGDRDPWPAVWGAPAFPKIPDGLTVTDDAEIAGNLTYKANREGNISPNASIAGEVDFEETDASVEQTQTLTSQVASATQQFFGLFLVGLLIVFGCPKWTEKVVGIVQQKPWASLGWGVLTPIGVIGSAILLLTATIVVAVLLGNVSLQNLLPAWMAIGAFATTGLIIGFLILANWVAKIVVSVWLGNRIINGYELSTSHRIFALALGLLVFVPLSLIPFVGSIISLVVTLIGVGSTSIWLVGRIRSKNPDTIPMPVKQAA